MIIKGMDLYRPEGYTGPVICDDGKGAVECHFVIRPADGCFVMNCRIHSDEVFEFKEAG